MRDCANKLHRFASGARSCHQLDPSPIWDEGLLGSGREEGLGGCRTVSGPDRPSIRAAIGNLPPGQQVIVSLKGLLKADVFHLMLEAIGRSARFMSRSTDALSQEADRGRLPAGNDQRCRRAPKVAPPRCISGGHSARATRAVLFGQRVGDLSAWPGPFLTELDQRVEQCEPPELPHGGIRGGAAALIGP